MNAIAKRQSIIFPVLRSFSSAAGEFARLG
jgi:hypothetical protein